MVRVDRDARHYAGDRPNGLQQPTVHGPVVMSLDVLDFARPVVYDWIISTAAVSKQGRDSAIEAGCPIGSLVDVGQEGRPNQPSGISALSWMPIPARMAKMSDCRRGFRG